MIPYLPSKKNGSRDVAVFFAKSVCTHNCPESTVKIYCKAIRYIYQAYETLWSECNKQMIGEAVRVFKEALAKHSRHR
jgi:hypothetical protein